VAVVIDFISEVAADTPFVRLHPLTGLYLHYKLFPSTSFFQPIPSRWNSLRCHHQFTDAMFILSPIPVSLSRKRSPSIAFDDATPPSSRPPSRAHTKRFRFSKHASERPSWVIDRDVSTRVDSRIDGFTRMDVRFPNNTLAIGRPVGGLMRMGGFTVLCFLGMGGETTLRCVGAVAGLLENLDAVSYGVSLGRVDENVFGRDLGCCIHLEVEERRWTRLWFWMPRVVRGWCCPLGGGREVMMWGIGGRMLWRGL